MTEAFEVRDFRDKEYFIADDVFLNGFAKSMDRSEILVYLALCRHANKDQVSYPSIPYLADKFGLSERQVKRAIQGLEERNMVFVRRDAGKHNTYILLDKKHWKKLDKTPEPVTPMSLVTPMSPVTFSDQTSDTHVTRRYYKDKKKKNTAPGFQPVLEFYLSKAEEVKGFKPELPKKDFSILSGALKKHGEDRVRNIILFFLDSEKANKHVSLSAALSADTINQYHLKWQKARFQYGDDAQIPTGDERWWS